MDSRHVVPSPIADPEPFVGAVIDSIRRGEYNVVFATGDAEVVTLSRHRDRLGTAFPYAGHEVVLSSFDKQRLYRAASEAGLSVPRTEPLARHADFDLPYIVKPRMHESRGTSTRVEAMMVTDNEQLDGVLAQGAATELLIQQPVHGTLMAFSVVCDRSGMPMARCQQVADAVYPMPAGISARARTVAVDEGLARTIDGFLEAIGWFGLAQFQFIVDAAGAPHLIDMNGRFYGSMALAVAAGANLPGLWADLALGHDVSAVAAVPGVEYQWLEGDLRAALETSGSPRSILSVLARSRGAINSIWSIRDPGPAIRYAGHLVGRATKRLAS